MDVKKRIALERKIVRFLLKDLVRHGYVVRIDDMDGGSGPTTDDGTLAECVEDACACDEQDLTVFKGGNVEGSILLVFGNDGFDVISDYSTSLEDALSTTLAYAEQFEQ